MLDQRWTILIEQLGGYALPLTNVVRNVDSYLDELALDALILTGGNDLSMLPGAAYVAPERDAFEIAAYRHFLRIGKPILGICRGAQIINILSGGRLVRVSEHAGTRHKLIWRETLKPYWATPLEVNSYHNWAIPADGLAPSMEALAWACADDTVEAFSSSKAQINSIVWHPEREIELTPATLAFISASLGMSHYR